jgi:hypothetical protein
MSDITELTEFYKRQGFEPMIAVEKAEKEIERQLAEKQMDHEEKMRRMEMDHEEKMRRMDHEEKMKGV